MLLIEQCLDDIDFDIKPDKKLYINDEGKMVPRVTDILSKCIFESGLMQWANSLGFKHIGYTRELNRTADLGTKAHTAIEHFFKTGEMDIKNISFMAFIKWWSYIKEKNIVELIASEMKLVCKYFGGTLDALIKINDKIFLVDFKTSNHITYKHMLQLAAYRYMLYITKGINIDGCIILQLNKESDIYQEYVLDFTVDSHYAFIEDCARCFLSLVYSYYNLIYIQQQYKMIF